jgi:aldehyde dehydrogenase (NAD+)
MVTSTMTDGLLIGGATRPGSGSVIDVINPYDEHLVASIAAASVKDAADAVADARAAFDHGPWTQYRPDQRRSAMHAYADVLERNADRLAQCVMEEMGSPASIRPIQIDAPIRFMRWAADVADRDFTESMGPVAEAPGAAGVVAFRPVGVVLGITAYNYPVTLGLNKIGSALAAGCTLVLMPSPQAPLSALLMGELAIEAGIPVGVVNVVVGDAEVARSLTRNDGIDKVSFTGSVSVGSQVMQQAAEGLKGVVLELGGKNPNIVLPEVELAPIIGDIHRRYARNAGQGCGSTTRIFIHESRYEEFVTLSRAMWSELIVGDPQDPATVAGPVISAKHRDRVLGYIQSALDDGGEILAQGQTPDTDRGFWVAPTLLGGVPHDSRAVQEEIFGPVAVAFTYATIDEVVDRANGVMYGLGGNIWTTNIPEGLAIAARLRAANITINGGGAGSPRQLIGGFKHSGVGREGGVLGIKEFLEPQTIRWPL